MSHDHRLTPSIASLTSSEIEALRADMTEAGAFMRAELERRAAGRNGSATEAKPATLDVPPAG